MNNRQVPEDDSDAERAEWRDAAITFLPAVAAAFGLNFFFESQLGWTSRRSLLTAISIGIVLALILQQLVKRVRGSSR